MLNTSFLKHTSSVEQQEVGIAKEGPEREDCDP